MNFFGIGHQINQLVGKLFGFFFGSEDETFGAGARHDAIEQAHRIGDHPRVQIILHRHRLAKQRLRIVERVEALRHGDLADLLQGRAEVLHVQALDQRHQRIRPAVAVDIDEVAALILQLPLVRDAAVERIARQQQRDVEMAALDGIRRAAHRADTAGAAIVGVEHPVELESQLFRHMGRGVRTRLRRDRQAVDVFFLEPGLIQRRANRRRILAQQRLLGFARIFRRPIADKTNFFSSHLFALFQSLTVFKRSNSSEFTKS